MNPNHPIKVINLEPCPERLAHLLTLEAMGTTHVVLITEEVGIVPTLMRLLKQELDLVVRISMQTGTPTADLVRAH